MKPELRTKDKTVELPETVNREKLKQLIKFIMQRTDSDPATHEEIVKEFELKDEREVRVYIELARKVFKAHIGNGKGGRGYCNATNWDEYKPTFSKQIRHAIAIIKTQNAIRKDFAASNSISLFDQSLFNSEFESIIQVVDNFQTVH